jgi:hypothetical protein
VCACGCVVCKHVYVNEKVVVKFLLIQLQFVNFKKPNIFNHLQRR